MDFSFITNLASDKLLLFLFIFLVCLVLLWIFLRLFKKNSLEQKQNTSIAVEEKKVEELKQEVLVKPIIKDFNSGKEVLPELEAEKEEKQELVSFTPKFQQVAWPRVTPSVTIPSESKEIEAPSTIVKPVAPVEKPVAPVEKPVTKLEEIKKPVEKPVSRKAKPKKKTVPTVKKRKVVKKKMA